MSSIDRETLVSFFRKEKFETSKEFLKDQCKYSFVTNDSERPLTLDKQTLLFIHIDANRRQMLHEFMLNYHLCGFTGIRGADKRKVKKTKISIAQMLRESIETGMFTIHTKHFFIRVLNFYASIF